MTGARRGDSGASYNPLHLLARWAPAPVDGLLDMAGAVLGDSSVGIGKVLRGVGIDAWDPTYIRTTLPLMGAFTRAYFRPDVQGLENVPDGPSLLVGNHSGGVVIADTFAFSFAFYDHFGPDRRFHQLAHDIAARLPQLGGFRRYGVVPATPDNARAAMQAGAPVLVYPGGDWETFRPSWHSDQIEFGGRKGFIRLALEEGVPIVPVVAIGGQETALFVTRGERLARWTRFDRLTRIKVLPVSIGPPFGLNVLDLPGRLPLPSKISIRVLPPVDLTQGFGDEPDVDEVYEHITGAMQSVLSEMSESRGPVPLVG